MRGGDYFFVYGDVGEVGRGRGLGGGGGMLKWCDGDFMLWGCS